MQDQLQVPAAIQGKFNIALTQSKFQQLANKADSLVYNEDNLQEISEFLKSLRAVKKAIDETHKEGKAEALKIGRDWDAAKNTFTAQVASIEEKPQSEYSRICKEIEQRRIDAENEKQRILNIKNGIETNAIKFSNDIARCQTFDSLSYVERMINLEKGRKEKYQEFLPNAVERFTELNSLLANQKIEVKKLEEIKRQEDEAKKQKDDEKLIELQKQREESENRIEEAKIVVQETAVKQSLDSHVEYADIVIPEVKARRTTWKFEMVNEKEVMKKAPELLIVSLNEDKAKEVLKTLKDTIQLVGKTELILNGIRYYEQKTF
jgi:hypothetical protein